MDRSVTISCYTILSNLWL